MGPIWGRQDPGGPHVGPMNFAIWEIITENLYPGTEIQKQQIWKLSKYIFPPTGIFWDVITHPCFNFNISLAHIHSIDKTYHWQNISEPIGCSSIRYPPKCINCKSLKICLHNIYIRCLILLIFCTELGCITAVLVLCTKMSKLFAQ